MHCRFFIKKAYLSKAPPHFVGLVFHVMAVAPGFGIAQCAHMSAQGHKQRHCTYISSTPRVTALCWYEARSAAGGLAQLQSITRVQHAHARAHLHTHTGALRGEQTADGKTPPFCRVRMWRCFSLHGSFIGKDATCEFMAWRDNPT